MTVTVSSERMVLLEERLALVEQSLNIQSLAATSPGRKAKRAKTGEASDAAPPMSHRPMRERRDTEVSIAEFSELDGKDFIAIAYRRILRKEVDREGLDYYLYELGRGQDKASILRRLASEPEALSLGCNLVD